METLGEWSRRECDGSKSVMVGRGYTTMPQRKRYAEDLRREMVAEFHRDRFQNRSEILDRFADRGFDRANLSRLFINGLADASRRINDDELTVPAPRPAPKAQILPDYDRKHIAYEYETDIKYLTRSQRFLCLDETGGESGSRTLHELISGYDASPLEILMEREDAELERVQGLKDDLNTRRDEYFKWEESRKPLQSLDRAFLQLAI